MGIRYMGIQRAPTARMLAPSSREELCSSWCKAQIMHFCRSVLSWSSDRSTILHPDRHLGYVFVLPDMIHVACHFERIRDARRASP